MNDSFDKLLVKLGAGLIFSLFVGMFTAAYFDNQTRQVAIKAGAVTAICIK